uniref:SSD domain-containing protein n=1 Tax=Gongylonema pulchrum TaxID=637853 RepID=A0A183CVV8_9BILA
LRSYCRWLSSGFTTTIVFILLLAYWKASISGALVAKGRLFPEKLFLHDSPMNEVSEIHRKIIMPSYTFVTIFVTRPGDLSNSTMLNRMKNMVAEFEAMPECKGPRFTHFWLRDYEVYLETKDEEAGVGADDDYTSSDLKKFLEWPEYESWGGFMKFDNQTNRFKAFYVTIVYGGANQSDWTQRHISLRRRHLFYRTSDIGASVYEDEALFTDQIETLLPTTLQALFVSLACMAVVCYIFMANIFTALIAVTSITSVCIGVFGFLTLWDVDLDPVSMTTIIMSVGLSVDFPAHITYHYHRTGLNPNLTSAQERLEHSFTAIGFPLLQCSLSTIIFVLVLLLVPCYMSEVSIVLVISLGTVHALVAVPALLCALSNTYQYFSLLRDNKVFIHSILFHSKVQYFCFFLL